MLQLGLSFPALVHRRNSPLPPVAQTIVFGALTLVGQGAAPISGVADGTYASGQFTVTSGQIVPSIALTVGTYDVGGVTVTVEANARTVATDAELEAILDGTVTPGAGETIYLRNKGSAYDCDAMSFAGQPSDVTYRSADAANRATINRWRIDQGGSLADITLRDLIMTRPYPASGVFWGLLSPTTYEFIRSQSATIDGFSVIDCEYDGQLAPFHLGGRMTVDNALIYARGAGITNITFQGNTIRNAAYGIYAAVVGFDIIGNHFYDLHADPIVLQNATSHCRNGVIRGNYLGRIAGDGANLHGDGIQFQPGGTDFDIASIVIEGNLHVPTPVVPFGTPPTKANNSVSVTASITLTPAIHHAQEIQASAASGNIVLTLPSAAASAGQQYLVRKTNATNTVTFALSGGDTWEGGVLPTLTASGETATFVSDGSGEWKLFPQGYRSWFVPITASTAMTDLLHTGGNVIKVDASAGDVTLTLPPDSAGAIRVMRDDASANTVTVQTSAGDTFTYNEHVSGPQTSLTLAQGEGWRFQGAGDGTFVAYGEYPTHQPFFSNPNTNFPERINNITIRGNLLMGGGTSIIQQDVEGFHIYNNTFLPLMLPDLNGDGLVREYEGNTAQLGRGFAINGATALSQSNFVYGSISRAPYGAYAVTPGTILGDIALGLTMIPATVNPALAALFNVGSNRTAYAPTTRAEALALIESAASGDLETDRVGAWEYWNFDLNQPRADLPAPVISVSVPADGDTYGVDGAVTVRFDQFITAGTGNVVLRNVTGNATIETFDIAAGTGDNGGTVAISNNVLTITPGADLPDGVSVSVQIAATAIDSLFYGTSFAGIADDTTLNFTTDNAVPTAFTALTADQDAYWTRTGAWGGSSENRVLFGFKGRFASGGTTEDLFDIASSFGILGTSGGILQISLGSVRLQVPGAVAFGASANTEILASVDFTQSTLVDGVKVWIDGQDVSATVTEVAGFEWANRVALNYSSGATVANVLDNDGAAGREFDGELEYLYLDFPPSLPDLDNATVRASFAAHNIGADGSGPTGSQPLFYKTGDRAAWDTGTNLGSLTGFSVVGAFVAAPTHTNVLYSAATISNATISEGTYAGMSSALPWYASRANTTSTDAGSAGGSESWWRVTSPTLTLDLLQDNAAGRSGFTVDSAAARWFMVCEFREATAGTPDNAFSVELRDTGGGGDYLRCNIDIDAGTITKTGGTSTVFGLEVLDAPSKHCRVWLAVDKPSGNTRLIAQPIKSLGANAAVEIARVMLTAYAGDNADVPAWVAGP